MAGRLPLLPLPDCVWPMIAGGAFLPAANSSQGPDGACGGAELGGRLDGS